MNGRQTIAKEFGVKFEEINGKMQAIPYISFLLPDNETFDKPNLDIKFRKYKVCDEEGNVKEAWFLATETFNIPSE